MKVAIVHDWLVTNAGAEKVLSALLDIYPDADVYSLVDFLKEEERVEVLHGKFAATSFLQKFPFAKKHFRNYLPLFPKAIESFDLSGYDLIISSSWAVAKGVKTNKNQLHISYYQARNMKYIWDEENLYFKGIKKLIKPIIIKYLKNFDLKSSKNADFIIVNSKFVKTWVKNTYKRKSSIIYPPVEIDKFKLDTNKSNYYITVSRLVPYKKTILIVEAFNRMPNKKLIVIGNGDEYKNIEHIAKENIYFLGHKNTNDLIPLLQKAKAFVYAALEDFGIAPLEALACGTPVIALKEGGTAETVIDGVNGIHFKKQSVEDIVDAIKRFERTKFDAVTVAQTAQRYSKDRFQREMKDFIESKIL